ncbi:MAG: hypothetical protein M1835_000868 [Candelina submexicana]|nr:MAG: hypothetical protein M1835_000868 [Candelina submexicana]
MSITNPTPRNSPTASSPPPMNAHNPGPSASPTASTANGWHSAPAVRLTDSQKKSNHILSEQKRRQAIRAGFDRLTELVPDCEGEARSESVVLRKTVEYCRMLAEERRMLVREIEARGGFVDEEIKGKVFWEGDIDRPDFGSKIARRSGAKV